MSIEAKRLQLKREAEELADEICRAARTKQWPSGLDRRITDHQTALKEFERQEAAQRATSPWATGAANVGSGPVYKQTKQLGRDVCPLAFSEESMKRVHKAMQDGQNIRVKAFSTVEPLLPPQLFPSVIGKIHEHRLLDRLPVTSMSAPSMEFLIHSSNTGARTSDMPISLLFIGDLDLLLGDLLPSMVLIL